MRSVGLGLLGRALLVGVIAALCWMPATNAALLESLTVKDIFGRTLNSTGLVLVDWEGYLANPAIKIIVIPPADAVFPASATLTADSVRIYFSLPSSNSGSGPTKTINFANASTHVPVYVSSFPDRDVLDGNHHLTIQFTDANSQTTSLVLDVHEIDQDQAGSGPYAITVDFGQDQTGFFGDPHKRAIIQQAAADFAYFIGDMDLDEVAAGDELTWIWDPTGFHSGMDVTNEVAYTGFLLYAYGIHTADLRSGGEPSQNGGFQSSDGAPLALKRSGGIEMETAGNFNMLGWFLSAGDHDWWVSGNFANEPNDLYSISHHEMGHAFVFHPSYPAFATFKQAGAVQDAAVLAYQGAYPAVDAFDHLNGAIDKASLRGAFGHEYFGDVPRRRWLITKLDLLVAQAIGYQLRPTSAFVPLALATSPLADGVVSNSYSALVTATGGIPFYNFTVDTGTLPPGLALNSFTGAITGVPAQAGVFHFSIRVQEYVEGAPGIVVPFSIRVTAAPLAELVRGGDFNAGAAEWTTFATPDMSYIVWNTTGGTFNFYRVAPPPATSNQAVVFQTTGAPIVANGGISAQFDLGNSSIVRKRITVLILDADFSDLSVCTFFLAPNAPLRTYAMRTHTTKAWSNAAIYFYAATAGHDGGFYRLDNVSVKYDPAVPATRTDCVDPTAPTPPGGASGPSLLTNGDFEAGLPPWVTFGQIVWQIANGAFHFYRPPGTPAGVVLQNTGEPMVPDQILTAQFDLGNTTSARKRVTILIHDSDFTDLTACTFWLPPHAPLSTFAMRTFTTKTWTSGMISFYPSTVSTDQWMLLDNVVFRRTPSAAALGSECFEPGGVLPMPFAPGSAPLAVAGDDARRKIANALPGATELPSSVSTPTIDRIDLRQASTAHLIFQSRLAETDGLAEVQVTTDEVHWTTIALVPASDAWTPLQIDLGNFRGQVLRLRFVYRTSSVLDDVIAWDIANVQVVRQ